MTRSNKTKAKAEAPKAEAGTPEADKAKGHEEVKKMVAKPTTTGETVSVGCKTPNGIVLQLQEQVSVDLPVLGGGVKTVKENRPNPNSPTHRLHGTATPHGEQPRCLIVGGYAITPGIPKDFMAKWMEQNSRLDLVTAGLIIVQDSTDSVRAEAREKRATKSGLEPLNMSKTSPDYRLPKRRDRDGNVVEAIETGDEQPKQAKAAA